MKCHYMLVVVLVLVLHVDVAKATTCVDFVGTTNLPTVNCGLTSWGIDDTDDGNFNLVTVDDKQTGILSAISDGNANIPGLPSNIGTPFIADSSIAFSGTSVSAQQSGSVSLSPSPAQTQDAFYETASLVTFSGLDMVSPGSEIPVDVTIRHEASISDGPGNQTEGGPTVLSNTTVQLEGIATPVFESFGGAEQLDDTTFFFGDYDGAANSTPAGPSMADISVEMQTSFMAMPNQDIKVLSSTIGSAFHNLFQEPNSGSWDIDSRDTFTITVSSSNSNVRFTVVVPEPSSALMLCVLGATGAVGYRRRSSEKL